MFRYYGYYIRALLAKYQTYFQLKAYERELNKCWSKILANKDSYSEEKLIDVTESALKAQQHLDKSWSLYHEFYNF